MFEGHYNEWILSRMAGIKMTTPKVAASLRSPNGEPGEKYILPDFFQGKTLLELGGGHAHNGNKFSELGAIVTTSDARPEHLEKVHELYPHLHTMIIDGDDDSFFGVATNMVDTTHPIPNHFDVILHWGLLYHLAEIEEHLKKIAGFCDVLLLETEVADAEEDDFCIRTKEAGYDQAFHSVGIRPSPSYVEKILAQNGFHFQMIVDPILNANIHQYDWEIKGTKSWRHGLRRFWICWKTDQASPLKTM
jgi:hypothetical protein